MNVLSVTMRELALSKVYQLLEPGPVVLLACQGPRDAVSALAPGDTVKGVLIAADFRTRSMSHQPKGVAERNRCAVALRLVV